MTPVIHEADRVWSPIAPPVPNDTAFYFRFFYEVASIRDQVGRPLHEVDFREELGSDGVRKCPYVGSRHGRKMNWTALRVIASDWREVVEGMVYLAQEVQPEQTRRDDGVGVWARSLLPMFLPLYLQRKRATSLETLGLTTAVSGLFKVMLDVPTTLDLMLAGNWAGAGGGGYSAEEIADYAETAGILNNGEWTCAGPPGLIDEVLRPVCRENLESVRASRRMEEALDPGEFATFASVMIRQYALSQAFQAATAFLMENAFGQIEEGRTAGVERSDLPSAYERRRHILLGLCRDANSCERVIDGYAQIAVAADRTRSAEAVETFAGEVRKTVRAAEVTPEQILEAQFGLEELVRAAVTELQREAGYALGSESGFPLDFSRFSRCDFPTQILCRLVNDADAGTLGGHNNC